jgi:transcriptional regulator with XRE-family HTH domain
MEDSTLVRKHRTAVQRQSILQDYRRSQRTQKEFAAQAGISVSTLQAWLRRAPASQPADGSVFVAVPNLLSASPAPPAYRLQWPGGLSLEVGSGFSAQELAALLQLLSKL